MLNEVQSILETFPEAAGAGSVVGPMLLMIGARGGAPLNLFQEAWNYFLESDFDKYQGTEVDKNATGVIFAWAYDGTDHPASAIIKRITDDGKSQYTVYIKHALELLTSLEKAA